jgi:hypothetical protein
MDVRGLSFKGFKGCRRSKVDSNRGTSGTFRSSETSGTPETFGTHIAFTTLQITLGLPNV